MAFHTKRSPSQAKKFLACAGCLCLCDTLPEEQRSGSGPAAKLGTATHALVEHCLKHGVTPEDMRDRIILYIEAEEGQEEGASILRPNAKTPKPSETFWIIDDDMIEDASTMTQYVRERCAELGVEESALQLETRTNPLPERDDTSGTADVTIDAWPEVLEVDDYKNGYVTVEHEDNEQAMSYLLGKAIEVNFSHEIYRTAIIQPNADHEEGKVRWVEYTKEELLAFQEKLRAGINRCEKAEDAFEDTDKDDVEAFAAWSKKWLKAGDHCLFCDASAVCLARRNQAEEQAGIDFADEPVEINLPVVVGNRALEGKSDVEQAAHVVRWAPVLESLIKAAAIYLQRAMEAGYVVDGFKLVKRRANREFRKDRTEKQLVDAIMKGGFIKDRDLLFSRPKLISGPQALKLVPAKKRREFEDKFLTKPDRGVSLAPESDSRPAVEINPGDDFEEIEEEGEEYDFG